MEFLKLSAKKCFLFIIDRQNKANISMSSKEFVKLLNNTLRKQKCLHYWIRITDSKSYHITFIKVLQSKDK